MKQLNKIQTFIFILGGVLMVIGAGCFAFGYMIYPQLTLYTSWLFLLGTIAFSVMQSMQLYEGSSQVVHRLKRIQAVADIFFVLSGISMVDTVYAFARNWFPTTRPISPISTTSGWCFCWWQPSSNCTPHTVFRMN